MLPSLQSQMTHAMLECSLTYSGRMQHRLLRAGDRVTACTTRWRPRVEANMADLIVD